MYSSLRPIGHSALASITGPDTGPYAAQLEKRMTKDIRNAVAALKRDESGQDLIEYGLVAGLVGLGAAAVLASLSGKLGNTFNAVGNSLTNSSM